MEVLLAILLIMYAVKKAIGDSIVDNNYAKQGLVSPRLEAKYGQHAKAQTARYGFPDFLRDAWSDHWQRRSVALAAARDVKAANPRERVRLRDRWAAAKRVVNTVTHRVVDPVEPRPTAAPESVGGLPPGTWTVDQDGSKVSLADPEPVSVPEPQPSPVEPTPPVPAPAARRPSPRSATPNPESSQPQSKPTNGDSPMTTPTSIPTGEATGIVSGVDQTQALRLRTLALREKTLADIGALARAVETLSASAAGMEVPAKVQGEIDRTQEALAAMSAAIGGTTEEVMASMTAAEGEFAKHLPVVEQSASLGGLARKDAYAGT